MIVPTLARIIVREHLYEPITGSVLTLGRQTIAMNYEKTIQLFNDEGYIVPQNILESTKSKTKKDLKTRVGKGKDFISDEVFFGLLGINNLSIMDVSSYEGADILHNLNHPIPKELFTKFDFIIDGGTFDHCFDLRIAFQNVSNMLKPQGRVFQWNAASNFTGTSYLSFGPDLFYDYYILNQFADCKVYVAEVDTLSQADNWDFYYFQGLDHYDHLVSKRIMMVVVLAQKHISSTCDKMPVQAQYRDNHLWGLYRSGAELILKSDRKPLEGTHKLNERPIGKPKFKKELKRFLWRQKSKISDKLKDRIPVKLKNKATTLLLEKGYGYRYLGRI